MNKYLTLCVLILFLFVILLSQIKTSSSFYNDIETSINNHIIAYSITSIPTPIPRSVIINEIYVKGDQHGEWVEILNTTNQDIDLTNYTINDNISSDPIPSNTTIHANSYAVIVTKNSSVVIPPGITTIVLDENNIGTGLNDTGDIIQLKSNNLIIDELSYGDIKTIFNLPSPSENKSLSRIPDGTDTNNSSDWIIDSSPTLGSINTL